MARRAPKKPKGKYLVVIDASQRRQAEQVLYLQYCEALSTSTEALKQFEKQDKPAFVSWIEIEFPLDLMDFRELDLEVQKLQQQVNKIFTYARSNNISHQKAYKIVMVAQLKGVEPENCKDEEEESDPEEFERFYSSAASAESTAGTRMPTESNLHIKSLYRQLVRKLHPDLNTSCSEEDKKNWHEVQEAYSLQDAMRLEKLLKKVSHGKEAGIDFRIIPIGDIIELREEAESRLHELKYKLRKARTDPAWNFVKKTKNQKSIQALAQKIGLVLENDYEHLNEMKERLEFQMEDWENPPVYKPHKSARDKNQVEFFED